MKKKSLVVLLAAALAMTFALTACGGSQTTEDTGAQAEEQTSDAGEAVGMANPNLYDVGYEEAAKLIDLPAPEGAENVVYNIIGYEDENPIIEMEFQMDGVTYYERAQATAVTALLESADDSSADVEALAGSLESIPDNYDVNLSGIYAEYDTMATTVVANRDGVAFGSSEGSFVAWLDVVPGIMYNLCTVEDVDLQVIQDLAGQVFVPVQGED